MLGFHVFRFWSDWGLPALLAWAAFEMQGILEDLGWVTFRRRLAVDAAAGLSLFLVMTSNDLHAWSAPAAAPQSVLALPAAAWALPDAGGILYTNDMDIFYQVFPRLPHAPFRYVAGFETALMPDEDLAVYRTSLDTPSPAAFAPWVARMRPQDRLILTHEISQPPPIPGLEWKRVGGPLWSGRRAADGNAR